MPPKKRGRKGKNAQTDSSETDNDVKKRRIFQEFLNYLDKQAEDYLKVIDHEYEICRQTIEKMYLEKQAEIPENYRDMTMAQFIQEQENIQREKDKKQQEEEDDEKFLTMSIIKKKEKQHSAIKSKAKASFTGKRVGTHRRSMSCPNVKQNRKVLGNLQPVVTPLNRHCRVFSETDLNTPVVGGTKLIPRTPLPMTFTRRPRVGELVSGTFTSVATGSPVQHVVDVESNATSLILNFGKGKFINIAEESNDGLKTCISDLDDATKEKVRKLLQNIL